MVLQRILQDASGRVTLSDRVADLLLLLFPGFLNFRLGVCLTVCPSVCLFVCRPREEVQRGRSAAGGWWARWMGGLVNGDGRKRACGMRTIPGDTEGLRVVMVMMTATAQR